MKLVQPTDFEILAALKGGRNVATNLSVDLDRDRAYLNTRMPHLLDQGLIEKIGPAERSGLYELTERGRAVLAHRDKYDKLTAVEFEVIVDETPLQNEH